MGWFTADERIIAAGVTLLWLTIALETGRTFNMVLFNALSATGDARYPMQAGAASFLLVMAGGSWLLGVHLGWGLVGVWITYAADEWLRGLPMWRRWAGHGWVPAARQSTGGCGEAHALGLTRWARARSRGVDGLFVAIRRQWRQAACWHLT